MSCAWPTTIAPTSLSSPKLEAEDLAFGNRAANDDLVDAAAWVTDDLELEIEQLREEDRDVGEGRPPSGEVAAEARP